MELYKLTAHLNNGTPSTFVFSYLPENFEGVKISQKFSFVNPMGYTPKFSIDTMRVIAGDKVAIDAAFLQYGLESDVTIDIQELNTNGTTYGTARTFAIDFESYEIFDEFSEFALKSVSVIDNYNKVKNTEVELSLTSASSSVPNKRLLNYVSLAGTSIDPNSTFSTISAQFKANNESKIYDKSTSMFSDFTNAQGTFAESDIYRFGENQTGVDLKINISGQLKVWRESAVFDYVDICLYKNNTATSIRTIYHDAPAYQPSKTTVTINEVIELTGQSHTAGDVFWLAATSPIGEPIGLEVVSLFLDLKITSNKNTLTGNALTLKYLQVETILNTIFSSTVSTPFNEAILSHGLTSANSIMMANNTLNIKPKDFLNDLCIAGGLMLNFKLDGSVEIGNIGNLLGALLNVGNAITISDFKDVSVRNYMELNFASVSAGQDLSAYDIYTYFENWNKLLTFSQLNRNASENLDLQLTKVRVDFSGILEYLYKFSKQNINPKKDNFLFNPAFTVRSGTPAEVTMYDQFTPRDILTNWSKFLSFCFQNYGKDRLVISSNGGTTDNLTISSVDQMDDFVIAETPRLLPLAYTFTALIDDIDFSEKILKLNHNGEDVYIFVTNAETMDNLSEQKITGLKIQF